MKETDGRKLDHRTLEDLRVRAAREIVEGVARVPDVARALKLAESTVYSWVKQYREGGAEALAAKPIPGRPRKMTDDQVRVLYSMLRCGDPRQLGFEFGLWTRWMVGELVRRTFAVTLSEPSVGTMLRRMGLSPQRPVFRAYEQDSEAVAAWKAVGYPAIRDEANQVGATIYFGDEAGVRSDYHSGTTWSPVGLTPVVASTGARHRVNMLSAVNAQGRIHFMITNEMVNSTVFIDFCERLLADDGGIVYLVVDNAGYHTSKATTAFVTSTKGKLRLIFLPTYAPETNPDELVWKNVKHDRIGKSGVTSASDLYEKATRALERLQKMPEIIRGFFRNPHLAYIDA